MSHDNQIKYLNLRDKYPVFSFEHHSWSKTADIVKCAFEFKAGDHFVFRPEWEIYLPGAIIEGQTPADIDVMVFHIGLIEMLSYWKAFCSPLVRINGYKLTEKQQDWWKKLFRYGLGEFFYTNKIPLPGDDLFQFQFVRNAKDMPEIARGKPSGRKVLVPVGGGKDSVVSLELLKSAGLEIVPFAVNPRSTTDNVLQTAGYALQESVIINRTIDPLLLDLNQKGFLNGHTPFSALLAFSAVFTGRLKEISEIALSNESSANEASIPGTKINHQYSKSIEFEIDFRNYVNEFIDSGINYFSLLRPLNELQISLMFAGYKQYHPVFRSCNVGSKQDIWCCKCSKCLFTFVMLSPFLSEAGMIDIFGGNLFYDEDLIDTLEALSGLTPEKPFECVGTLDDVNIALVAAIKKYEREHRPLPVLLAHYQKSSMFEAYKDRSMEEYLGTFNEEHFVPERYLPLMERG
jgi:UDP-N-acetyl-alpha-D-muramoyl-L-alanyl-L-glutamate epimerase